MRAVPVLRKFFAGAVQDYGIGKIVGTTTYGKGRCAGAETAS